MQDLASKIAVAAALMAGSASLLLTLPAAGSRTYALVAAALVAAVVGLGVRLLVRRLVTRRLDRVAGVLMDLRTLGGRHDHVSEDGDEIERLVRMADQAQHVVDKRVNTLSRAESYRREYVGDVSHEIKTPIFAIQGFAETLLNGALDDPAVNRGFVEKILHHAARLNALAKDLAEISRFETGTLRLTRVPIETRRVFEDVRESLEHGLREKGMQMDIDISEGADWVDGDRDRLRQVITNLADNAMKYNDPGGHVRLVARREDGLVRWSVSDDGIGIAPEDLARVTERFYRADKSRSRSQGGTGLGLAIVKHILVAHGSSLEIESTYGVGSTFSFKLPAAKQPVAQEAPV